MDKSVSYMMGSRTEVWDTYLIIWDTHGQIYNFDI